MMRLKVAKPGGRRRAGIPGDFEPQHRRERRERRERVFA